MSEHSVVNNKNCSTINSFNFMLFFSSLLLLENILLHPSLVLLTIQDNTTKLLSLLPRKFIYSYSKRCEIRRRRRQQLKRHFKATDKRNEHFIIELNARPSFIIFSYLFTPSLVLVLSCSAVVLLCGASRSSCGVRNKLKRFYHSIYFTILSFLWRNLHNSFWVRFTHQASWGWRFE